MAKVLVQYTDPTRTGIASCTFFVKNVTSKKVAILKAKRAAYLQKMLNVTIVRVIM